MRQFLTIVLPILVPILVYAVFLYFARRQASARGDSELPGWQQAPWAMIAVACLVLVTASLLTFRSFIGVEPGVKLEPPHLVDGVVQPSRVAE